MLMALTASRVNPVEAVSNIKRWLSWLARQNLVIFVFLLPRNEI
jgi:hypothetical protein